MTFTISIIPRGGFGACCMGHVHSPWSLVEHCTTSFCVLDVFLIGAEKDLSSCFEEFLRYFPGAFYQ